MSSEDMSSGTNDAVLATVLSTNNSKIRLMRERWAHITRVEGHHGYMIHYMQEVLDTIAQPERILDGHQGALLAIRLLEPGKYLGGIYREIGDDGFIITAFLTNDIKYLSRRSQLWP